MVLTEVWCDALFRRQRARARVEKIIFGPFSKGRLAKNLYTKSEGMTLSCRVKWAWSERVNLYSRQIMILPRKTKTCATYSGPWPPSGRPGADNMYRHNSPFSLVLIVTTVLRVRSTSVFRLKTLSRQKSAYRKNKLNICKTAEISSVTFCDHQYLM